MNQWRGVLVFLALATLGLSARVYSEDYGYSSYDEGYGNTAYGGGYGSGYGYSSSEDQAGDDADEVKPELSNCVWVQFPGPNSPTTSKVAAYPVPGCQDAASGAPKMVCSGTARCDVTMLTNAGKRHTFNASFVSTMCASRGNSCPQAGTCLAEGGLLAHLRSPLVEHGNRHGGGKTFQPRKVNLKNRTHN